eukprot:6787281-Alexandrium_andersonii.AAC.1
MGSPKPRWLEVLRAVRRSPSPTEPPPLAHTGFRATGSTLLSQRPRRARSEHEPDQEGHPETTTEPTT